MLSLGILELAAVVVFGEGAAAVNGFMFMPVSLSHKSASRSEEETVTLTKISAHRSIPMHAISLPTMMLPNLHRSHISALLATALFWQWTILLWQGYHSELVNWIVTPACAFSANEPERMIIPYSGPRITHRAASSILMYSRDDTRLCWKTGIRWMVSMPSSAPLKHCT